MISQEEPFNVGFFFFSWERISSNFLKPYWKSDNRDAIDHTHTKKEKRCKPSLPFFSQRRSGQISTKGKRERILVFGFLFAGVYVDGNPEAVELLALYTGASLDSAQ